jgi:predicted TIM-barrel fold metal-dependent hydrolase
VRSPASDAGAPDVVHLHSAGKPVLPGTSLAGVMRAQALRIARLVPKRLVPFLTAWPQAGRDAINEVRRVLGDPISGDLKFHSWLQGFSTADAVFEQICGFAGEVGVSIVLHDGTPPYSLPEQVAGLARRFSRTTFLLGHSGLLWSWRSALEAARQTNVWLCLCGPHLRGLEILCEKVDPTRIVWGSDYGFGFADQIEYRLNWTCPRF